jgi:hypothetical protein
MTFDPLDKLPDDVPEDLKQQLMSSGILGNAEVQVRAVRLT